MGMLRVLCPSWSSRSWAGGTGQSDGGKHTTKGWTGQTRVADATERVGVMQFYQAGQAGLAVVTTFYLTLPHLPVPSSWTALPPARCRFCLQAGVLRHAAPSWTPLAQITPPNLFPLNHPASILRRRASEIGRGLPCAKCGGILSSHCEGDHAAAPPHHFERLQKLRPGSAG